MKRYLIAIVPLVFVGCGAGSPPINNRTMTEEEIRQMKDDDKRVEDEELGGAGTAVAKVKKKR